MFHGIISWHWKNLLWGHPPFESVPKWITDFRCVAVSLKYQVGRLCGSWHPRSLYQIHKYVIIPTLHFDWVKLSVTVTPSCFFYLKKLHSAICYNFGSFKVAASDIRKMWLIDFLLTRSLCAFQLNWVCTGNRNIGWFIRFSHARG